MDSNHWTEEEVPPQRVKRIVDHRAVGRIICRSLCTSASTSSGHIESSQRTSMENLHGEPPRRTSTEDFYRKPPQRIFHRELHKEPLERTFTADLHIEPPHRLPTEACVLPSAQTVVQKFASSHVLDGSGICSASSPAGVGFLSMSAGSAN